MRDIRPSGSVEGVVSNHDPYSDWFSFRPRAEEPKLLKVLFYTDTRHFEWRLSTCVSLRRALPRRSRHRQRKRLLPCYESATPYKMNGASAIKGCYRCSR